MAAILILGGGFGGVVAAELLAKELGREHQITLVSRNRQFLFYPALVRLAFGKCEASDISYDLRKAMLDRRVRFLQAEVARVDPYERKVTLAGGDLVGHLGYDYLIFAFGRRLATENIPGFFEYAHHLLNLEAALKFGTAIRTFNKGRALIGFCQEARLITPVYETAFALARMLKERNERDKARITVVTPEPPGSWLGGMEMARALRNALDAHDIELLPDFRITGITSKQVATNNGLRKDYDLLMLVPPFRGAPALTGMGITDEEGFVCVNSTMRVRGVDGMYAVGDCVNFPGPKLGHMAVMQAEVAATNLVSEVGGAEPNKQYRHEITMIIDEGGSHSIFLQRHSLEQDKGNVKQARFWSWAKRIHEKYWQFEHS